MAEKKNIPEIRFKGFEGEWEEKTLDELSYIKTGCPFDSNDFNDNGEYLVITNGNIQNDSSNVYSSIGNRIDIQNNPALIEYILNVNDILVTMDGTVGRSAKVVEQKQILAQRVGRLLAKFDPEYLYQYLNTGDFFKEMSLVAHGGTIKHISLTEIGSYKSYIPDLEPEQTQIGTYFQNLDSLITLHQRKYNKLLTVKKAMLEKMFPKEGADVPEIRFKGFVGKWEKKKLGEIGSVVMNRRIFKDQTAEKGEIPFYKIGTFGGKPDAFITRELFEEYKNKYPYPKYGDILISASGSIGRTVEYLGIDEYFQDSNIVWLEHDQSITNTFLKYFYTVVKWEGLEGSTIKRLYNKNILDTKINLPSIIEQTKIGTFFQNLDDLINQHKKELAKLKNLKKACLEKMFV